ncbi:hypothetical protein [Sphingobium aquiterrae]|uniref:hypothetical protein n=1 Tax=Sphingobium aquiterrae TaxID=2038656 RepID=UPI0030162B2C
MDLCLPIRRLRGAATLLAVAALSACGQQQQDNASLSSNIANVTAPMADTFDGNANEAVMETETPDTVTNGEAAPAQSITPVDRATIPARLRGEWTGLRSACDDAGDPLRLSISDRALRYYESVGEATSVAPAEKGAVIVTARFSGEGDSWTRAQIMSVSPDGQRLTIVTNGAPVTRKRCAGGA